ncbi:nitrate ABC transporter ATP-binding protein [Methanobrevibacter sp. 87.7]|uniref:ABC transporter ATP-binding protein n=1 Tax=Methanobrevibacter sp. 87.7 TaxID=387957 RepID=UPI000B50B951|nr:ABC transporter ATP-binding protein [Methanobrevibacter sp. 87.7]OWT32497.1 nitrate ABC transporter ATP-binding protein [Methanobrevibacter sp. 87.7]
MTIEIKNLTKTFKNNNDNEEKTVLDNLNLTFEDKKFICLVGHSGCGKTTLLRLIGGLDNPSSGEILEDGKLVNGPSTNRGFIFQQYSLFPWMTVFDNVMFPLRVKGDVEEKSKQRVEAYLKGVGLESAKDLYPYQLSGGMKQRVALIRTLINHPKTVLMDEPFSALDMLTKHDLQDKLLTAVSKYNTIIFVTHDISEATYLADEIVVMGRSGGEIKDIINVDVPRPRKRNDPELLKIQDEISEYL